AYDFSLETLRERGGKFAQYRRLESLQEYVLISSDRIAVEVFCLNERGKWELTPYAQGETIQLSSVALEFPIEQLYVDVELAEPPNAVIA
ncbi:MAG TPA: Uma2 family endonuclease, partial [Nodosilinea sp.]|nr:Uma2 family endonuclease [Nodosilinea sp.]